MAVGRNGFHVKEHHGFFLLPRMLDMKIKVEKTTTISLFEGLQADMQPSL